MDSKISGDRNFVFNSEPSEEELAWNSDQLSVDMTDEALLDFDEFLQPSDFVQAVDTSIAGTDTRVAKRSNVQVDDHFVKTDPDNPFRDWQQDVRFVLKYTFGTTAKRKCVDRTHHGISGRTLSLLGSSCCRMPIGVPKQPMSSYSFFLQSRRETMQKSGDLDPNALGSDLFGEWQQLSEEHVKHFNVLAERDLQRYRRDLKAYDEVSKAEGTIPKEPRKLCRAETEKPHIFRKCTAKQVCPSIPVHKARRVSSDESDMPLLRESQITDHRNHVSLQPPHEEFCVRTRPMTQSSISLDQYSIQNSDRPLSRRSSSSQSRHHSQWTAQSTAQLSPHRPLSPSDLSNGLVYFPDKNGIQRAYRVEYKCYRMKHCDAEAYIERYSHNREDTKSSWRDLLNAPPPPGREIKFSL